MVNYVGIKMACEILKQELSMMNSKNFIVEKLSSTVLIIFMCKRLTSQFLKKSQGIVEVLGLGLYHERKVEKNLMRLERNSQLRSKKCDRRKLHCKVKLGSSNQQTHNLKIKWSR